MDQITLDDLAREVFNALGIPIGYYRWKAKRRVDLDSRSIVQLTCNTFRIKKIKTNMLIEVYYIVPFDETDYGTSSLPLYRVVVNKNDAVMSTTSLCMVVDHINKLLSGECKYESQE